MLLVSIVALSDQTSVAETCSDDNQPTHWLLLGLNGAILGGGNQNKILAIVTWKCYNCDMGMLHCVHGLHCNA